MKFLFEFFLHKCESTLARFDREFKILGFMLYFSAKFLQSSETSKIEPKNAIFQGSFNPKKTGGGCPTPPQSFIVCHFKLVQGNVLIFGDFSVQAF